MTLLIDSEPAARALDRYVVIVFSTNTSRRWQRQQMPIHRTNVSPIDFISSG